jgi:hypothetical protein
MIIPGFLISWATFPGVIVHELGHYLFCRLRRVLVFDACFFRMGNPAGYVVHGPSHDFTTTFLICVGPLLLNTALCLLICLPSFLPYHVFGERGPLTYLMLWLGISIGMHAFPSTQDATNLWKEARIEAAKSRPLALISLPLVGLIFVANAGRFFWLDYLYGLAVGLGLPSLLL